LPGGCLAPSKGDGNIRSLALILALFTLLVVAAPSHGAVRRADSSCAGSSRAIVFYRSATWRWQEQRGAARSPAGHAERSPSCTYQRWAARRWRDRAREQRELYSLWFAATLGTDAHPGKWLCIHEHEGAWNASNDGYGGGLQMDAGFQHTYGPEFERRYGWASKWPVWAQLIAAERAFHGFAGYGPRGFGPWPNTARACGLL
jgi:hypothetical protein